MQNVISILKEKEKQFKQMQQLMINNQTLWNNQNTEPYTAIA